LISILILARVKLTRASSVKITRVIELEDKDPVKIYIKNPNSKTSQNKINHPIATNANGAPKRSAGLHLILAFVERRGLPGVFKTS
jgi:hypothetical protein